MVEKEREAFAEFFEGKNVKKVLDASCGSGEQAIALATPYYLLYYKPYYVIYYYVNYYIPCYLLTLLHTLQHTLLLTHVLTRCEEWVRRASHSPLGPGP